MGRWPGYLNFVKLFLEVVIKQALFVQTLVRAIDRINHYPTDTYWGNYSNCTIHWTEIHPVDSTIQSLNNRGQESYSGDVCIF